MKIYQCHNCNNQLYFENNVCLSCGSFLGFSPSDLTILSVYKNEDQSLYDIANSNHKYVYCANAKHHACNWLIEKDNGKTFCKACQLNETIPDLASPVNKNRWRRIEKAKHRLVYSLLRMGLRVVSKDIDPENGLAFHFKETIGEEKIMTGHYNGDITINIEEADEVKRTKNKKNLGERYRTLLGHFRHEVGHYYWDQLIKDGPFIEEFRTLFGDDREDYAEALKKYYATDSGNWTQNYISMYASSHPWEDWAETWAHYLHLTDTLETASAFGLGLHVNKTNAWQDAQNYMNINPYLIEDFNVIIDRWIELTFAFNSVNRSMGHQDFYPFVISENVKKKLAFVHKIILNR